jgi:hypothetical protein
MAAVVFFTVFLADFVSFMQLQFIYMPLKKILPMRKNSVLKYLAL